MAMEVNMCSMVSSISDMSLSLDFSTVDDNVVLVVLFGALQSDRYEGNASADDGIMLLLMEGS